MLFHAGKVLVKVFTIVFEILLTYCVNDQYCRIIKFFFHFRHLLSSQEGINVSSINSASRERVEDVEDILIASASASDNNGCSNNCRARTGAGRYRCDSEVRFCQQNILYLFLSNKI